MRVLNWLRIFSGQGPEKWVLMFAVLPAVKTTHLAQTMQNSGTIVAVDLYPKNSNWLMNWRKDWELPLYIPLKATPGTARSRG
jgi:hypothetical protein